MNRQSSIRYLIPVLISFYVMGFVDIVGVATVYIKNDFGLSDTVAQLLPSMVFLWFALISIPTGIFQDRKGKRVTVNLGIIITCIGMIFPFIYYSYVTAVLGFMVLGIGNTIMQVSANPLLLDISSKENKAANLSFSQFVKAIASMLGPIITAGLAKYLGNWKIIFLVYAGISMLTAIWISSVKIEESKPLKPPATFKSVITLFKNRFVIIMVLATFLIVGFDVGINSNIAIFLSKKFLINTESASIGISIYFASLMVGRFTGAILLRKMNSGKFLVLTTLLTLLGLAGIILSGNLNVTRIMIFIAGLGFANIFPIIFALTIERMPDYSNELSGLIILSVSGGAVIPPLMGIFSDNLGIQSSIFILVFCILYVGYASYYIIRK
ncbi:MAG: sugar transporter [Bacteroidetes bacterium RBG_13_43_22]|nr:MAG: sugar transporter [Bacteroidetes bacterium RBG_13_43_22]